MTEKKIFLLHEKEKKENMKKYLEEVFESRGINAKVETPQTLSVTEIPRGFDVYMLHLPEIREKDVETLRKEQPWSWIYGLSSGPEFKMPASLKKIFDEIFFKLREKTYDKISEQIKNYRIEK